MVKPEYKMLRLAKLGLLTVKEEAFKPDEQRL